MISRKLIALAAVTGLSFTLVACGDSEDTSATTDTAGTSAATTTSTLVDDTPTPEETTTEATTDEDPVFQAIDAVLAEYSDGIITDIDREDATDAYEIDVVVGQEVYELDVNASTGEIRVDDRENDDDDDIREATDATVTAAEAIMQALDTHPDGVLDEISLDGDDDRLEWDIDLDDSDRNDLTELTLPAR